MGPYPGFRLRLAGMWDAAAGYEREPRPYWPPTFLLNIVRSLTVGFEWVVLIFIADQCLNINVQVRTCDGLLAPYRRCQASNVAGVTIRCRRSWWGSRRVSADRIARSGYRGRGLAHLTAQYRDFVAQDQDLGVLRSSVAGGQSEPAEHRGRD